MNGQCQSLTFLPRPEGIKPSSVHRQMSPHSQIGFQQHVTFMSWNAQSHRPGKRKQKKKSLILAAHHSV